MYYVYVLQSLKDKKLYIGYTTNLKRRLKEHKYGVQIVQRKGYHFASYSMRLLF